MSGSTHCISSALLLYRLMAVFHDPPFMPRDPYKQCWKISLEAKDNKRSRLNLFDWKGAAMVSYRGSEENSKDALQLVDWLIGNNVPHSYDYTLCGRVGMFACKNNLVCLHHQNIVFFDAEFDMKAFPFVSCWSC
jgi:hypothetical protein